MSFARFGPIAPMWTQTEAEPGPPLKAKVSGRLAALARRPACRRRRKCGPRRLAARVHDRQLRGGRGVFEGLAVELDFVMGEDGVSSTFSATGALVERAAPFVSFIRWRSCAAGSVESSAGRPRLARSSWAAAVNDKHNKIEIRILMAMRSILRGEKPLARRNIRVS